jgi:hypothetical protein
MLLGIFCCEVNCTRATTQPVRRIFVQIPVKCIVGKLTALKLQHNQSEEFLFSFLLKALLQS